jgi:hypothetical protein
MIMIGRRSVVIALEFLRRGRGISAVDGWRLALLIERIAELNEIEAACGFRFSNSTAELMQDALRALEPGDLDEAERLCERAEVLVVQERAGGLRKKPPDGIAATDEAAP